MTVALSKLRGRVRANLSDLDGRMAAPSGVLVDHALADAYIALQSMLPPVNVVIASGLTIAAGGDTFTMPVTIAASGYGTGTVEYAGQIDLQLVSTGLFLKFQTMKQMEAWRHGQQSLLLSIPQFFGLYEDRAGVVQGRCYPGAKAAEACHITATIKADDLRDYVGTGGAEGFDTVTAALSREGAAALVLYASADILMGMGADDVAKRGKNPAIAARWIEKADDLMYAEAMRRHSMEDTASTVQVVR